MKYFFAIITLLFLLSSQIFSQNSKSVKADKPEEFDNFIMHFMTDSLFQVSRVKFPCKKTFMDDNLEPGYTTIKKSNWKHQVIYFVSDYRVQIYDNFEQKLEDTNERVISFIGVDSGINLNYYFQRIDNLWYLIHIEDIST